MASQIDDELNLARRVAEMLGEASAAAKALADYDRRLAAGDMPVFFRCGHYWVVAGDRSVYEAPGYCRLGDLECGCDGFGPDDQISKRASCPNWLSLKS